MITEEQLKEHLKTKENRLKENLAEAIKLRKEINGLMTTLGIRRYPDYNKLKKQKQKEMSQNVN